MHVHVLIAPEEVDELLADLSGGQRGVHVQKAEEQQEEERETVRASHQELQYSQYTPIQPSSLSKLYCRS